MNEQLIVKNFGPIKDATVDFKKVTVFIGPTGGGKSTLAKLAAIFRDVEFIGQSSTKNRNNYLIKYGIDEYSYEETEAHFYSKYYSISYNGAELGPGEFTILLNEDNDPMNNYLEYFDKAIDRNKEISDLLKKDLNTRERLDALSEFTKAQNEFLNIHSRYIHELENLSNKNPVTYIPAERIILAMLSDSLFSIATHQISLPQLILEYGAKFNNSILEIDKFTIDFLELSFISEHETGLNNAVELQNGTIIELSKSASGIQSTVPLYTVIEHLSNNPERPHSFVVEEPELNLYPMSQQKLLNWLINKCTVRHNDLIITTHSPYILSHLNLLLYAYQVAEKHPDRADDVAKIVPRESWINSKEFACYQVENGGVESLVNEDLGLIDDNGLDNLSGDAADAFDNLIRLSKSVVLK